MSVCCPYCGREARLTDGREIYPHRPDLAEKQFYLCRPCSAFVGCHPGTVTPLGTLANKPTRQARSLAHAMFDPIWKSGMMKRREAYKWLSDALGVPFDDCHIGLFDEGKCRELIVAIKSADFSAVKSAKHHKCETCGKRFHTKHQKEQHGRAAHPRAA